MSLSSVQVANLATLGRVWGFLKYHHPRVTSGQLAWDFELFRILPAVVAASDRAGANAELVRWIDGLGEVTGPTGGELVRSEDLYLSPDLAWLRDEARLGAELSRQLVHIHGRRPGNGTQHYVSLVPGISNPLFKAEASYPQKAGDAGYRLLGLYRWWNIVRYWFPYRDLLDDDWDATLEEFIPRVVQATQRPAYQREMLAVIARVKDTHANLWSARHVIPPEGDSQLPVVVRFVEGHAVVTQLLPVAAVDPAGLQVGDIIAELDGEPVEKLIARWTPYYAASNQPTRLRDMAKALTRGPAGEVQLLVRRDGSERTVTAMRQPRATLNQFIPGTHDLPGETFRLLTRDIAYLKLSSARQEDAASYVERASGTQGMIIDIRNYPGSFQVFALGSLLVDRPVEFARFTHGDLNNPGAFHFGSPIRLQPRLPHYSGKIVILVDEVSQSQAEYTAMAFRAVPGAKVVGSTTAGADGDLSWVPLPGGLRGAISGLGVFYPDKRPTQRIGIVPDIAAAPTLAGIRAGRDEVLEVAIRQILGPAIDAEAIIRITQTGSPPASATPATNP